MSQGTVFHVYKAEQKGVKTFEVVTSDYYGDSYSTPVAYSTIDSTISSIRLGCAVIDEDPFYLNFCPLGPDHIRLAEGNQEIDYDSVSLDERRFIEDSLSDLIEDSFND